MRTLLLALIAWLIPYCAEGADSWPLPQDALQLRIDAEIKKLTRQAGRKPDTDQIRHAINLMLADLFDTAPEVAPTDETPPAPTRVPTPADAVAMAAFDLSLLPFEDQLYQRYFFTLDRSPEFKAAFDYIVNTCISHATPLYRSVAVADGWVLRVDLRRIWPRVDDFDALLPEFEKLAQIEPYFHTHGVIKVQEKRKKRVKVTVPRYRADDGRWYDWKWEEQEEDVEVQQLTGSEHSLHLIGNRGDESALASLVTGTGSAIPICRADWFITIVANSNPDENGRYYQFRRISRSRDGKTAEQLWLESRGADYAQVQKLRSDQRAAMSRSKVTGKPRAVEFFYASSARPQVGPTGVALTRDWFIGQIDPKRHPFKNLLNYKYDGTESMAFLPNGMVEFVLFDAEEELVDIAPDKLVSDRTVAEPFPTILTTPISCIRCHGPTDMWMDAPNHVNELTKDADGLDIFDDEGDFDSPESAMDRLLGLYAGDTTEFLRHCRNTHDRAVHQLSGGMSIPVVANKVQQIYNGYRYNPVTTQQACLELGWAVSEDDARVVFGAILPKLPPNRFGKRPEAWAIGTLRRGRPDLGLVLNRDDWEQEYADAMLRVTVEAIRQQAQAAMPAESP